MVKYCSKCKRKLKEEEVCDCNHQNKIKSKIMIFFKNWSGIFLNPSNTTNNYLKGNQIFLSITLIILTSLLGGLLSLLITKTVYDANINEFLSGTMTFGSYVTFSSITVPYAKTFILTTIGIIVGFFLLTLILYLIINKVFKLKITYKNTLNIISLLSYYLLTALILSFALMFISIACVYILLIVAFILTILSLCLILRNIYKLEDYKCIYSILITFGIFSLICLILLMIFS